MKDINVAVLLSVYNGEKYLEAQLDSILSQSYDCVINIYIRNDGSSDSSESIIRNYTGKYENIHFMDNQDNLGCARSFFELLFLVRSDYYFFCDQDDVWHTDKIRNTLALYGNDDTLPILAHTDLNIVDEELNVTCDSFYKFQKLNPEIGMNKNKIVIQNYIVGCTICINEPMKQLLDQDFIINNADKIAMHDWWVALCAVFFAEVRFHNEPSIDYRQHNSNVLGAKDNSLSRYLRSFLTAKESRKRVLNFTNKVSSQAEAFGVCYENSLDSDDKKLVNLATAFKVDRGFRNMFDLQFVKGLRMQGVKRNLALLYTALILK
ncbi:glycosyltransferase family 2 protein [Vibrio cholerae]